MRSIGNAKTKILEVASDLLKKDGLAEFNMRTIAKLAHVSVGTVYNYYPAKSDLVVDIMENLLRECCAVIDDESGKSIYDKFRNIYFQMLGYFNLFQANLMQDLMVLASSEGNPSGNIVMQHMKIFQDAFKRAFEAHRSEIDPRVFTVLGIENAIGFIIVNYNDMIRHNVSDFTRMEFLLRKLLQR